jgi:cyclopropane fatty-acyl-phospholipid synthase-like methyltransferase
MENKKKHWESVYINKQPSEVSWTQDIPATSLKFIEEAKLDKTAKIIDIGGGDSKLIDFLLEKGYENISVLDISVQALERAKKRLGAKAEKVTWIVADINDFKPETNFDFWHDRATFHFLTTEQQIENYLNTVQKAVNGYLMLGTFSENGPKKCSGLDIKQYSEEALSQTFQKNGFQKIKCLSEDHTTPFNTIQNFTFCSFKTQQQ